MAYLSDVTHRSLVERQNVVSSFQDAYDVSIGEPAAQDLVAPEEAGIIATGKFFGGLRCNEVHRTPGTTYDTLTVWAGEQDGALCVRDALGNRRFTIEKKSKVFVTALMCHGWDNTPGRFMYAGMSDGNLRVYDQINLAQASGSDYELICVKKKHTAGITCMISVRDLIITGGRDWQIFMWKWEGTPGRDGDFACIDQFWGHQNAVRCLTYDQGPDRLLYSGGDDCSIKCLQLESGVCRSVPGGFPIEGHPITKHGHKAGIRALVVYEKYLFSASEDGTIKVWDSQDGTYVNTMFRPSKYRSSNSAILTLLKDPAGGRIWAGGTDGVIRVFSAYDHVQICHIEQPHNGAMVTGLTYLGRLNAIKGWFVSKDGTIRVIYSESDTSDDICHTRQEKEIEMSREIEDLRTTSLDGFRLLEERKREQIGAVERVNRRQDLAISMLVRQREFGLKQWGWHKLMSWYCAERSRRKRQTLAVLMGRNSKKTYMALLFNQLRTFAAMGKERRQRVTASRAIATQCKSHLQVTYYAKLRAYANRQEMREHKLAFCQYLMSGTNRGLRTLYYSKWAKFLDKRRSAHKRMELAEMMRRTMDVTYFRSVFYYRWVKFLNKQRHRRNCAQLCEKVKAMREKRVRETFLRKASKVPYLTERRRFREDVDLKLKREATEYSHLMEHREHRCTMNDKDRTKSARKIKELEEKIAEIEGRLGAIQLSEEEIAERTAEEDALCAEADSDMADLEAQINAQELENFKLAEELRKGGRTYFGSDSTDKVYPISYNVMQLVKYLKAHTLHCRYDRKLLESYADGSAFKELMARKIKKKASPKRKRSMASPAGSPRAGRRSSTPPPRGGSKSPRDGKSPARRGKSPSMSTRGKSPAPKNKDGEKLERVFVDGVNQLRDALVMACQTNDEISYSVAEEEWQLPTEVVMEMPPMIFKRAAKACQQIVYGMDMCCKDDACRKSTFKNLEKASQTKQLLKNQDYLFDVVHRLHLDRKLREYLELGPKYIKDENMGDDWIGKIQAKDIDWGLYGYESDNSSHNPGSFRKSPRVTPRSPHLGTSPKSPGFGGGSSSPGTPREPPAFVMTPAETGEFFCPPPEDEEKKGRVSGIKVGTDMIITSIAKGSPAEEVGLMVGDKITDVGGKMITKKPGFVSAMKKACGAKVIVGYSRKGRSARTVPKKVELDLC